MSKRALVVGPSFIDIVMSEMGHLPESGEEVHVGDASWAPGGYAISAIALSRLAVDALLVTDIGQDELGQVMMDRLAREGVDTRFVQRTDRTNIAVALNWSGDRGIVSYTHPLVDPTKTIRELLDEKPDVVMLSARHPFAQAIAADAFQRRVPVALSLSWHPEFLTSSALQKLFPYARYLFSNVPEALMVTGETEFTAALRALGDAVPEVVITRGAAGVAAIVDRVYAEAGAEPAIVRDSTGAGDVFASTYLAAAVRGLDLDARLSAATWAAAQAVGSVGGSSGAPDWQAVEQHLQEKEAAR